jgi:hypothetical protein
LLLLLSVLLLLLLLPVASRAGLFASRHAVASAVWSTIVCPKETIKVQRSS